MLFFTLIAFAETLDQGLTILEQAMAGLQGKVIPGETVFRLYDTFGFPVDLTADIAREHQLDLDMAGFETEMDAQRERARAASQFHATHAGDLNIEQTTDFTGYEHLDEDSKVVGLFMDGKPVDCFETGHEGVVVLERSSFYAESGGQVGDTGMQEHRHTHRQREALVREPLFAERTLDAVANGDLGQIERITGR